MEVQLLGDVAVIGDRGVCRIDAPLSRRCMGALALSPGTISLDGLADALWGDDPPANWKPALRNVVAKLRSRLDTVGIGGTTLVVTSPSGYRLSPLCTVDIFRAFNDADAADEALADGDPDRALDLATSALDRFEQELLPDVDANWLAGYRTRLAWATTRTLQVAAAASRITGRPAQAVDYATRAVLADPLTEESHRQLMHAHAAAGDRAGALRAFESCRRTLVTELGVAPDQETVALHLSILGTEEQRPPRPRTDGPFHGRERELASLRAQVAAGNVVCIVGPGGIGKSRLAAAYSADPTNDFDGALTLVDVDALGRGGDLTTFLAMRLGVAAAHDNIVPTLLDELAARGRNLLVLDGVDHVADDAARLITAVQARCPQTAVVVTGRVPLGLDGEDLVRPAPLDPDGDGYECFVAYATAAGASLPPDASTRSAIADVCRALGGNPLGIELAARQVAEVSLADLAERLADSHLDDEGRPTELVGAVLDSTVDLLDDAELEVFRSLSVMGGPADLTLIEATIAGEAVPVRRVVRVLAQLAQRALVRVDRGAVRWRYDQHPLVRSAAAARLSPEGRQEAYGRLATALFARLPPNAMAPPRLGDIDPVAASVRSLLAAALAGEADVGTALRLAFWLHRYWAARSVDEGIRWLERLLAVAAADDPYRAPGEVALGYLLGWAGRPDPAIEHLLSAAPRLGRDDPLLPFAHWLIANASENRHPDLARRHFTIAIEVAEAAGRDDVATSCRLALAVVEFEAGEREAALARFESGLGAVDARGGDDAVVTYLPQFASMLVSAARFDDADRVLQRAERQLGDDVRIATMHTAAVRARLERHRGRPEAARRHARRAVEMIERSGVARLDGHLSPTLALLDLADGDPDAAIAELARGAKAANATDQVAAFVDVVDAAVVVAAAIGRTSDALELADSADAIRSLAQVERGIPERAELEAALAGLGAIRRDGAAETDRSRIADVIVGLAAR